MTAPVNHVAEKLSQLFRNGRVEVGLEVGTDAGLSPNEYIHVPRSLAKAWAYRKVGTGTYEPQPEDTTATLAGKPGWTVVTAGDQATTAHTYGSPGGNVWFVTPTARATGTRTEVDRIHVDSHTYDDLRRFLVANQGHVREDRVRAEDVRWVHATRFWAVATGLVMGTKNREYTLVDDPVEDLSTVDELAEFVVNYQGSALTASAARAASWRRSNHATGGSPAAGFPRRWLEAQGFWASGNARVDKDIAARQTSATDAFYVATHATAVHNTLALMAPLDEGHWASIDPRWGLTFSWDILTSTTVRIAPKTQVAGTAMIVDSMVVLRQLTASALAPLLENFEEWKQLKDMYDIVEAHGVRAASYAQWFLDGHPQQLERLNFNQKDSACANLVGELAVVATTYYAKSTIGESMALANAAKQLGSETSKDLWSALAKEKRSAGQDAVVKAYRRIMGASAATSILNLGSDEEDIVVDAVGTYNDSLKRVAAGIGMPNTPAISAEMVTGAMGASDDEEI